MIFSLIHVSDLHFRNDYDCIERLSILKHDIISQTKNRKPYLIFSGDLVHSGDENAYDSLLDEFFAEMDEFCAGIYIVPGNHDIQQNRTDAAQCALLLNDISQKYLFRTGNQLCLDNPFTDIDPLENYRDFDGLINNSQESNYFGYFDKNPHFEIVGLNSTWLSHPRNVGLSDLNNLKIDPAILDYFTEKLSPQCFKICMLHHPLDWISERIRQRILNSLTEYFDMVVFGHVHNPASTAGSFNTGECLFLQAPTVKSDYTNGANAYTRVHVDSQNKKYEIIYRTFSAPQRLFVPGVELADDGIRYPTADDRVHWAKIRNGTRSGLLERFSEFLPEIDYDDWYQTHIRHKSKVIGGFVQPNVTLQRFKDGEPEPSSPQPLAAILESNIVRQFIVGPQDCGLTSAAFLTLKYACERFETAQCVPVYINLEKSKIDKASFKREAVRTCPLRYTHAEMSTLIDEGGVLFLFDQVGLPETDKVNKLLKTMEDYFPDSKYLAFCALDSGISPPQESNQLSLDPTTDQIYDIQAFGLGKIEEHIRLQEPRATETQVNSKLNHVVASFKQMDEPIYPTTVGLLLETLRQFPTYRPLNRVRLLDRYVECLLGRFDLEDVQEGVFNSTDKVNFLSYIAGRFAEDSVHAVSIENWNQICEDYSTGKMLDLPKGLLEEFCQKGILFSQSHYVTFRADYIFSYFVAKEMHQNSDIFDYISNFDAFYQNRRELVFYGELEGVDNSKLLDDTYKRLGTLDEEIIAEYLRSGTDLDQAWKDLQEDNQTNDDNELASELEGMSEEEPTGDSISKTRSKELSSVNRRRGVQKRRLINELELKWLITIKTYFELVKHGTNLDAKDKLRHLNKALESSELFVKSMAAKKDTLAIHPIVIHSGIMYINPLAIIDPEASLRQIKYNIPECFSHYIAGLMSNPLLAPALRATLENSSEIGRFLARGILLEIPNNKNRTKYVDDIKRSDNRTLQTCSLRSLKSKYLNYSIDEEYRKYYSGIISDISTDKTLSNELQPKRLNRKRLVTDLKKNVMIAKGNKG